MLSSSFTPLRRNVGRALPIAGVTIIDRAPELQGFAPTIQVAQGTAGIVGADYGAFLPESLRAGAGADLHPPIDGVGSLPAPIVPPFHPVSDWVASIRGVVLPATPEPASRDLWMELEVRLAEPALVGGVAFAGHPLLPYTVDAHGELSSNNGLPREVRLRWRPAAPGFIDDETAISSQEPSSHGGFHYLMSGPVRTDRVFVRLADFPRFIRSGSYRAGGFDEVSERLGLCIPFLYVFEHRQGTRFAPHVPGATLAAVRHDGLGRRHAGELLYLTQTPERRYFPLSAGTLFGQARRYTSSAGLTMREKFCSSPMQTNDRLVLYVEQADDTARCLAGMLIRYGATTLPGLRPMARVELSVYEVDPRQGFTAIGAAPPTDDRFATRLFHEIHDATGARTLRFVRTTASRYLALVFSSPGGGTAPVGTGTGSYANVCIDALELVQSAHVAVVPRPSRNQRVNALNYRLIGPGLLDDYARVGTAGFTFTVERVVAGERKEVLFAADSLLDLVQDGGARVIANHRYFETVEDAWEETSTTHAGSFDNHRTSHYSTGWQRSETGAGVGWREAIAPPGFDAGAQMGFSVVGNNQTRTRTELVGYEGLWTEIEGIKRVLEIMFPMVPWPADPTGGSALARGTSPRGWSWANDIWRGQSVDRVGLVRQLGLPPWLAVKSEQLAGIVQGLGQMRDWIGNGAFPPTGPLPTFPLSLEPLFDIFGGSVLLNGTNVSFGVGASYVVGANFGFSWAPILPQLGYQSQSGSQGTITQSASETGYSYAQHLNTGGAHNLDFTTWDADAVMRRRSARTLDQESVDRVRRAGAEVMWQGSYADVIVGKLPLGVTLPATAGRMYRTTDESIVIRFGGAMTKDIACDVWFDLEEEWVRDDS